MCPLLFDTVGIFPQVAKTVVKMKVETIRWPPKFVSTDSDWGNTHLYKCLLSCLSRLCGENYRHQIKQS